MPYPVTPIGHGANSSSPTRTIPTSTYRRSLFPEPSEDGFSHLVERRIAIDHNTKANVHVLASKMEERCIERS